MRHQIPNGAFGANSAEPVPPTKQVLTQLETVEQLTAYAMYLIDSAVEPPTFSFFDIDCVIFTKFIEEAETLPQPVKLALAISLLGEVLLMEQQDYHNVGQLLPRKATTQS
ncbi:hypothetical protein D0962_20570 [Leptolyngbyaceae cyanobacterium CCMR0082]|uniref:Uncharacterized protein n=1 Tax=Adonisia turfae CCMR0082 TaxID=2304604 RepID=A0A6M0S9L7_9CYAN|nr:hypothetical protein [Adonisia turfae]NEZ65139.1 hypothetical protein [Adonisia turfae CCMR0082]